MRYFIGPILVSIASLIAIFIWGGTAAFFTALLLAILEITLSFDNAVVNAKVLSTMDTKWQGRFLTWGILFAVFFTRLILPVLIVSVSVGLAPLAVAEMAAFAPEEYGHLLENASDAINSFGAAFLLMVSLKYFLDSAKTVHWFRGVEHQLARLGKIEAVEIGLSLLIVMAFSFLVAPASQSTVLIAGVAGIALFIFMRGVAGSYSEQMTQGATRGFALFIYLNILDTAFSLDSVVGAFALTSILPVIVAGLGIGAYFVRSLTIYLVRQRTLDSLVYLEHGAHWAIFGLAASMYAGLLLEVPEIITGTVGAVFVFGAYYSSLRFQSNKPVQVA